MAEVVYILCALTSLACAALLIRGYRRNRSRLLLWSCLSFVALAANNVLLFVDLVVVPSVDLSFVRAAAALCGMVILVYGLVWDAS
jgi:hypothetical protein